MTADPPRDDADDVDEAEDALNWDTSSRDASYVEGPKPVREKKPRSVASAGEPASDAEPASAAEPVEAGEAVETPTSSILLVSYGIIAGIFLLYAIGWFTTVRRSAYIDPSVLGAFMSVLGEVLAVAAAPVWFGAVFLLTRDSKPIVRLLWLLLGLLLLIPVPFVLGV
jgi:hypothetical protein